MHVQPVYTSGTTNSRGTGKPWKMIPVLVAQLVLQGCRNALYWLSQDPELRACRVSHIFAFWERDDGLSEFVKLQSSKKKSKRCHLHHKFVANLLKIAKTRLNLEIHIFFFLQL